METAQEMTLTSQNQRGVIFYLPHSLPPGQNRLKQFPNPRPEKLDLPRGLRTRGDGNRSNWTTHETQNWNRTADHSFEVPFYADYDLKDWAKFVSLFSQFRPRDGLLIEVDWYRTWVLCILRNNTRQRFITFATQALEAFSLLGFHCKVYSSSCSILQGKSVKGSP